MNDAFYIAATGMRAHQTSLDTVATNLVNANTVGFKRANVVFSDLVTTPLSGRRDDVLEATSAPSSNSTYGGVGVLNAIRQFDSGELRKTDAALDVAIQGDGFFEVSLTDGASAFTRGGTLKVGKDGALLSASGLPIKPGLVIPDNAQNLIISPDGKVHVTMPGQSGVIELGQISLVKFNNPSGLTLIADNLYRATELSGEARSSRPGEEGAGVLAQGMLESSNVKMVDEMMSMMLAQRAYEASLKVLQTADELAAMTNNLRKG
jgi:flagellar basal-body rod protein FlgG